METSNLALSLLHPIAINPQHIILNRTIGLITASYCSSNCLPLRQQAYHLIPTTGWHPTWLATPAQQSSFPNIFIQPLWKKGLNLALILWFTANWIKQHLPFFFSLSENHKAGHGWAFFSFFNCRWLVYPIKYLSCLVNIEFFPHISFKNANFENTLFHSKW